ncbi:alanine racemase [Erysipelotrichaceae bacterium OttesenSCG-928-M19]|nr:alanine racemase [Erysipelotrichaceae bacterium OttesenSCG-928-M19]
MEKYYRNSIIEIDLDTLLNNVNEVKDKCSADKFLYAVIKGDAYGHGIKQMAQVVVDSRADGIAVATLDEAFIVRKYHPNVKILCLGIIRNEDVELAMQRNITLTIAQSDSVKYLASLNLTSKLKVHLKVNTGMNRIGFKEIAELEDVITQLQNNENVEIEGIFTHFATGEDYDKEDYLMMQLNRFKEVVQTLAYNFKQIHCTNSSSLLKFHHLIDFTNTNRVGITLYGALQDKIQDNYQIKAAFVLKSKIAQVQVYPKGYKVGYSNRYTTLNDNEIIATIPLGYADGFSRLHTNSKVKCNNQYGTIVGSICMDQLMIRFENPVNIGDEIILLSDDKEIDIYQRCHEAQTITHAIFTRFGNRIPKAYYKNNQLIEIDNALMKK